VGWGESSGCVMNMGKVWWGRRQRGELHLVFKFREKRLCSWGEEKKRRSGGGLLIRGKPCEKNMDKVGEFLDKTNRRELKCR